MAATKTVLMGGAFQDSSGNVLANGYLTMKLSQDAAVSGVGVICSGIEITIQLDVNGNVVSSPAQSVWANTGGVLAPINTFYKVTGYTARDQRAFGPNNQQVAAGATFNLGSWVPNQVIQWFPTVGQSILLQTNEVNNGSQNLLDLHAGSGVTLTDNGSGQVTIAAGSTTAFDVNGTPTTSQTLINFESGSGITVSNPSAGNVLITNTNPIPPVINSIGGGFWGPGLIDLNSTMGTGSFNTVQAGLVANVFTANQVAVYRFTLPVAFTITKITWENLGSQGGITGTVGIYSLAGNLLVDGGQWAGFPANTTATHTIGAVTLPAGTYWHAQGTTGTGGFEGLGMLFNGSGNNSNTIKVWGNNSIKAATAANALSAGALPATLGALTSFVPIGNSDGIACPLYESA